MNALRFPLKRQHFVAVALLIGGALSLVVLLWPRDGLSSGMGRTVAPQVSQRHSSDNEEPIPGTAASHRRSRVNRERESNQGAVPFNRMDSQAKFRDLTQRISDIKSDLENSEDPAKLVGGILSDIKSLDAFGRRAIYGSLENELAKLDDEEAANLDWLARNYPSIKDKLKSFSFDGKSSESHMFSLLVTNARSAGINILDELERVTNHETKTELIQGILPHQIVQDGDLHPEILDSLPQSSKDTVYQGVIELSAIDGIFREQALDLYLENLGKSGDQKDIANRWFSDSAWFWANAESIARITAGAPAGKRRDFVIAKIISLTKKSDESAARQWLDLLSDEDTREMLSKEIGMK